MLAFQLGRARISRTFHLPKFVCYVGDSTSLLPIARRAVPVQLFRCILPATGSKNRNTNFARLMGRPLGELMKFKAVCTIACCFLGLTLVLGEIAAGQQRNAGGE